MNNTLKNWRWHILVMKYFTLGPLSPGRVSFDPPRVNFDPGSIFFISLPKITQLTQYFVCCLQSHYLRINRNHSSMIKRYTILQWLIHTPGQNWPALCWWGLRVMNVAYHLNLFIYDLIRCKFWWKTWIITCYRFDKSIIWFRLNKLSMTW